MAFHESIRIFDQSMTDLVTALKNGNAWALEALFESYHVKVFNFCYSYLGSKEETEEIVQDVFVKLWTYRDQIKSELSINGLIFKIAKNLTLNKIRDNAKLRSEIGIEHLTTGTNYTEESIFFKELEQELMKAIETLPPKRKEVFKLSRFNGLSNKEISEQMNISVNTVEGQMRKAIKYLHDYLDCAVLLILLIV